MGFTMLKRRRRCVPSMMWDFSIYDYSQGTVVLDCKKSQNCKSLSMYKFGPTYVGIPQERYLSLYSLSDAGCGAGGRLALRASGVWAGSGGASKNYAASPSTSLQRARYQTMH
jgi:hypothetical protein